MDSTPKGRLTKGEAERERDTAAFHLVLVARDILESPSAWTRKVLARDRHSHPVSPTSERAVRFCLSGALLRAASEEYGFSLRLAKADEPVIFDAPEPLLAAYRAVAISTLKRDRARHPDRGDPR